MTKERISTFVSLWLVDMVSWRRRMAAPAGKEAELSLDLKKSSGHFSQLVLLMNSIVPPLSVPVELQCVQFSHF